MPKKNFLIKLDLLSFIKKYNCHRLVSDYQFLKSIKLFHNPRLRRSLGTAHIYCNSDCICGGQYSICLSTQILQETYNNLRETLIHEFCHLVAYKVFGDEGHGQDFKKLMAKYFFKGQIKTGYHHGKLTTKYVKRKGKTIVVKL